MQSTRILIQKRLFYLHPITVQFIPSRFMKLYKMKQNMGSLLRCQCFLCWFETIREWQGNICDGNIHIFIIEITIWMCQLSNMQCCFLQILDGESMTSLAMFCGGLSDTYDVTSSSHSVIIRFHTDSSVVQSGWRLVWSCKSISTLTLEY